MGDQEFTFENIEDEFTENIKNKCSASNRYHAETRIYPSGCLLNKKYAKRLQEVRNFEVFPDDTWVITFPKCGSTWMTEMVWLLKNGLNYEKAMERPIRNRFPFLEWELLRNTLVDASQESLALAANAPRPRCIKTHLPPELLPSQLWQVKPKVVYVARNPNDQVVSYYHHHQLWNGYSGTFPEFFEAFIAERVTYSPYWPHILSYWSLREKDHVLFTSFEQMKRDLRDVIKTTAEFLEINVTEEQISKLENHLSIENMKKNKSVNYKDVTPKTQDEKLSFIRSGAYGGWRTFFTDEMTERMANWSKKHLEGTGFTEYPW